MGCENCENSCCKLMSITLFPEEFHILRLFAKQNGITMPYKKFGNLYVMPECTFLADDGRCRVYEIRPHSCRKYPLIIRPNDDETQMFLTVDTTCPLSPQLEVEDLFGMLVWELIGYVPQKELWTNAKGKLMVSEIEKYHAYLESEGVKGEVVKYRIISRLSDAEWLKMIRSPQMIARYKQHISFITMKMEQMLRKITKQERSKSKLRRDAVMKKINDLQ